MARHGDGTTGSKIAVSGIGVNGLANCTVAVWVKSDNGDAGKTIWEVAHAIDSNNGFDLRQETGGLKAGLRTNADAWAQTPAEANDTDWHHWAVRWFLDVGVEGKVDLFKDGVLEQTLARTASGGTVTQCTEDKLGLFHFPDSFAGFVGALERFAIWDIALSDGQIATLATDVSPADTASGDLLVCIMMDDADAPEDIGPLTKTVSTTGTTVVDGPFAGGDTFTGTSALSISAATFAGEATFSPGTHTGTSALSVSAATLAGTATFTGTGGDLPVIAMTITGGAGTPHHISVTYPADVEVNWVVTGADEVEYSSETPDPVTGNWEWEPTTATDSHTFEDVPGSRNMLVRARIDEGPWVIEHVNVTVIRIAATPTWNGTDVIVCTQWDGAQFGETPIGSWPDWCAASHAARNTTTASGDWSDDTKWSLGHVPIAGETCVVAAGHLTIIDVIDDEPMACIGVKGTLKADPTRKTRLTTANVIVYPGGELDLGTAAAPIDDGVSATIVMGDALYHASDTERYGNGFLNVGTLRIWGAATTHAERLAVEADADDQIVTLANAPTGWAIGDRVLILDSHHFHGSLAPDDELELRVIEGVSGANITLNAPLDYDHHGARDADGNLKYLPHVVNLERNAVIRSQNPLSRRRPHMCITGTGTGGSFVPGVCDLWYASIHGLGRTTNAAHEATGTVDALGTTTTFVSDARTPSAVNDIEEGATGTDYWVNSEVEFMTGALDGEVRPVTAFNKTTKQFTIEAASQAVPAGSFFTLRNRANRLGLLLRGLNNGPKVVGCVLFDPPLPGLLPSPHRWGLTISDSHHGNINGNISYNWAGAGYFLECSNESKNNISENFAILIHGDGSRADSTAGLTPADRGRQGSGFWLPGCNNTIEDNVASSCAYFGITAFILTPGGTTYPATSGTLTPTAYPNTGLPWESFARNEVYGSTASGIELWFYGCSYTNRFAGFPPSSMYTMRIWHVHAYGTFIYPTYNVTFDGWELYADRALMNATAVQTFAGFHFGDYTQFNLTLANCTVHNFPLGIIFVSFTGTAEDSDVLPAPLDVIDCDLRAWIGFDRNTMTSVTGATIAPRKITLNGCTIGAIPGFPLTPRYDVFSRHFGASPPSGGNYAIEDLFFVENHNGVALDDFQLYYLIQDTENKYGGLTPPAAVTREFFSGKVLEVGNAAALTISAATLAGTATRTGWTSTAALTISAATLAATGTFAAVAATRTGTAALVVSAATLAATDVLRFSHSQGATQVVFPEQIPEALDTLGPTPTCAQVTAAVAVAAAAGFKYELWRSTAGPITLGQIAAAGATLAQEFGIYTRFNRFMWNNEASPEAAVPYVSTQGTVLADEGIAVYHPEDVAADHWYAVVANNNGVRSIVLASVLGLAETRGNGPFVLQGTFSQQQAFWYRYVRFEPSNHSNVAGMPHDYIVAIPDAIFGNVNIPVRIYEHALSLQMFAPTTPGVMTIATNSADSIWWLGNYRGGSDPYFRQLVMRRLASFIDFVKASATWSASQTRIYGAGTSMGGNGFARFARYLADRVTHVQCLEGNQGESWNVGDTWLHEQGGLAEDYLNGAQFVTDHPDARICLQILGHGTADVVTPYEGQPEYWTAMLAERFPFVARWDGQGHTFSTDSMHNEFAVSELAISGSLPAFSNGSLDQDPFTDPVGEINVYTLWTPSGIVDTATLWSVPIFLASDSPTNPATVDVTPRNVRNFKLIPGHEVAWTLTEGVTVVDSGTETVDAAGRVTAEGISIRRAGSVLAFTTSETDVAPVIRNVLLDVRGTRATVRWDTNEAADSQVEYGLTTSYGTASTLDAALVTAHSVSITGLAPLTLYHARIKTRNAGNDLETSRDYTFTTEAGVAAANVAALTASAATLAAAATFTPGDRTGTAALTTSAATIAGAVPWHDSEFLEFHHETIRNFGYQPNITAWDGEEELEEADVALVAVGANIRLQGTHTVGTLAVAGRLYMEDGDTAVLNCVQLLGYPGSELDIPEGADLEIVILDRSITDPDDLKFGNGVLWFGRISVHGVPKSSFLRTTVEPLIGAEQVTLASAPTGWEAGDIILIPPTVWTLGNQGGEHAELRTITSIDGAVIHFAGDGLDRDHLGARDASNALIFLPHVANLTRNVVIRSAAANATVRGHTFYTDYSDIDISDVQFKWLGRTTSEPLHPVTNQVGRYPVHFHHVVGAPNPTNTGYQGRLVNCVVWDGLKWNIAIHDTHYCLFQGNVSFYAQSGCFVTEDGSESYNDFLGNFGCEVYDTRNPLGVTLGAVFWMNGFRNTWNNNVAASAYGNAEPQGSGFYTGWNTGTTPFEISLERGKSPHDEGTITESLHPQATYPISFDGNEAYASSQGLYLDHAKGTPPFAITNFSGWHQWDAAVSGYDAAEALITDLVAVQCNFRGVFAYSDMEIVDADIQNCQRGIHQFGAAQSRIVVEDSHLDNIVCDIECELTHTVGPSAPDPSFVRTTILRNNVMLAPLDIRMLYYVGSLVPCLPQKVFVYDHQGEVGNDFRRYWAEQDADFIVPWEDDLAGGEFYVFASPEEGLTNQETWDLYGIAIAGEVAPAMAPQSADLVTSAATCSATAAHVTPTYTGAATLTSSAATLAGSATFRDFATPAALLVDLGAHWKLREEPGEVRLDSFGANHLAEQGGTVAQVAGALGMAAEFHGATHLAAPDAASLSTGNIGFTFATWFWISAGPDYSGQCIASKGQSTTREWLLRYDETQKLSFQISADGAAISHSATWGSVLAAGPWRLAVVWHDADANTINIQIDNGTPVSVATGGAAPADRAGNFRLASEADSLRFSSARLDEAAFWRRALTDTERTRLWNEGAPLPFEQYGSELVMADAALTTSAATLSAAATFVPLGTSVGAAALTSSAATLTGSATRTTPTFTVATAPLLVSKASITGTATAAPPGVFTGTAALATSQAILSATATRTAPVFTGTGTLTASAAALAGSASFAVFSPASITIAIRGRSDTALNLRGRP